MKKQTPRGRAWPAASLRQAAWLKALAHPARLAILEQLASRTSCCCGDLVETLPLAQATVSQHLAALKKAGFIQGTITGPSVCYCIDRDAIRRALGELSALFHGLQKAPSIPAARCRADKSPRSKQTRSESTKHAAIPSGGARRAPISP